MTTKSIEEIWKSGKNSIENQPVTNSAAVRKIAGKHIKTTRTVMLFYASVYLLVLAATLVFESLNLVGYRSNPGMMTLHWVITALIILFIAYGIFLVRRILDLDKLNTDLITALRQRLRLFRVHYEIWLWVACASILMLTFAINAFADNENGHYKINNPLAYLAIEGGIFFFVYLMMKLAHYPIIQDIRSHLTDLEQQTSEFSERSRRSKLKWRWWALAGLILVATLLVWAVIYGIIKYS